MNGTFCLLVGLGACACVLLQGCGSSTHTTKTTTTTTTGPTIDPNTPQGVAKFMNEQYHSFDPKDKNSGIGVYLRMTEEMTVWCGKGKPPGCQPDCRISGSIVNDKMMLTTDNKVAFLGNTCCSFAKGTAWFVNNSVLYDANNGIAKCSFAWDGGTQGKLNGGCGINNGHFGCDDKCAPFYNMTGPQCDQKITSKSPEVTGILCDVNKKTPTEWDHAPDCAWQAPGYFWQDDSFAKKDQTWEMLKWRVDHQNYAPPRGTLVGPPGAPEIAKRDPVDAWNELVIDGDLLLKELRKNAAQAIPAIVYDMHRTGARGTAEKMANQLKAEYNMPKAVPVIAMDTSIDATQPGAAVFVAEEDANIVAI